MVYSHADLIWRAIFYEIYGDVCDCNKHRYRYIFIYSLKEGSLVKLLHASTAVVVQIYLLDYSSRSFPN